MDHVDRHVLKPLRTEQGVPSRTESRGLLDSAIDGPTRLLLAVASTEGQMSEATSAEPGGNREDEG